MEWTIIMSEWLISLELQHTYEYNRFLFHFTWACWRMKCSFFFILDFLDWKWSDESYTPRKIAMLIFHPHPNTLRISHVFLTAQNKKWKIARKNYVHTPDKQEKMCFFFLCFPCLVDNPRNLYYSILGQMKKAEQNGVENDRYSLILFVSRRFIEMDRQQATASNSFFCRCCGSTGTKFFEIQSRNDQYWPTCICVRK